MRILLVQPGSGQGLGFRHLAIVEPLGLETIAGGLVGHELQLLDLRLADDLAETLARFRPDVCAITCCFTVDLYRALEAARVAKASPAGAPFVVVGGHHASLNSGDFRHPAVDAVVIGEGEVTMPELVACLERGGDLRAVRGLALNIAGQQERTGVRKLVDDLDKLPMPARDLTQPYRLRYYLHMERPAALVETARGCPYHCNFCSVWRFYRGRFRAKSPHRVVAEVAAIKERYILFTDDNFLADIARARQIAELSLAQRLFRRYAFQARSDSIVAHPEIIKMWRRVGLVGVFVGIEKIDDDGLSAVNKDNSATNNERALEILTREGVGVVGSFIVDPDWDRPAFAALRCYIKSRHIATPSFTVLTPLPGTTLYRQLRDRLQTRDYELFDLLHAVLPTRLPLPEFYAELAGLYRSAYTRRQILAGELEILKRASLGRDMSVGHLRKLLTAARTLRDATAYLAGHQRGQPNLSHG